MKAALRLSGTVLGAWLICAQAGEAPKAEEARIREEVANGLTFLARENDAWVGKETCLSCHHGPMLLWSQAEAARHGLPMDPAKVAEWTNWIATYANAKASPEELAFVAFATAGTKPQGVPGPTEVARLILAKQLPDGSWKATGRFAANQRRTKQEAQEASTLLSLIAISAGEMDSTAARAKADAWLAKCPPPESTETLIFQALLAKRSGDAAKADDLRSELLAGQHEDGGWPWRRKEPQSDAFTAGLALFALSELGTDEADPALIRARRWLLAAQRPDGAWPVASRLISASADAKYLEAADPIYTTWATAWAELGLLRSLP
jgi:hypothetical protein